MTDSLDDIKKRMILLGKNEKKDTLKYLNLRLITSIIIFFVILYFMDWGYVLAPIIVITYYLFLPRFTLDVKINRRKKKIESEEKLQKLLI